MGAFTVASRGVRRSRPRCEFIAVKIWPLSPGWYPFRLKKLKFSCLPYEFDCPIFGMKKPEGFSDHTIVSEVERDACNPLGPWNRKEYDSFMAVCKHVDQINRCFEEMEVTYEACVVPPPPIRHGWCV